MFEQTRMLRDKQLVIIGTNAIYIPYLPEHVEKYHKWMTSTEQLAQTASEPLSLEEEYEMQITWSQDADKRTFIILSIQDLVESIKSNIDIQKYSFNSYRYDPSLLRVCHKEAEISGVCICEKSCDQEYKGLYLCNDCLVGYCLSQHGINAAVGDVNLFMHEYLQDDEEDLQYNGLKAAEIEIMIADVSARRQKLGQESVEQIMQYGREEQDILRYIVKISNSNVPSITQFQKLGFVEFASVECFEEIHFHWIDASVNLQSIINMNKKVEFILYTPGEALRTVSSEYIRKDAGNAIFITNTAWGEDHISSMVLHTKLVSFEQERISYYDNLHGVTKTLTLINSLEPLDVKSCIIQHPNTHIDYSTPHIYMELQKQDTNDKKLTILLKKLQLSISKVNGSINEDIETLHNTIKF